MAGSSLRNCVQRRNHKERSQLAAREKRGILEKHKDYQLRARDYHRKRDAITLLERKAALRNPDEYYRAMNSAKVVRGEHRSLTAQREGVLDHESVTVLKTQDARYIAQARSANASKLRRLEQHIHIQPQTDKTVTKNGIANHTVFVDSDKELAKFDPVEHFQTPAALLTRTHNRPTQRTLEQMAETMANNEGKKGKSAVMINSQIRKQMEKEKQRTLQEIVARQERDSKLKRVQLEMDIQRNLMGKGSKKKVGVDSTTGLPIWKWKTERKK